jgi:DUF4097 and DUF4098 domain-containing protein YvlB
MQQESRSAVMAQMKRQAHLALCLGVCLGLATLSGSACALDARGAGAEGTFSRTLSVNGPVDLDVQTGSGDIQIRTGAPGTVEVRGRVRCWNIWSGISAEERVRRVEADPPVEQSGNVIRLGGPRGVWAWDAVSVAFDVIVPPDARVRTRSGSGNQIVGSVRGPVESSAGSGDIRIGPTVGNVRVSTGSGRIELEGSGGSVLARAGSGSIRAMAVSGDIEVHAGSGRVFVAQTAPVRTAVTTTAVTTGSGDITVSDARGSLRLHAASGDVAVDGEPAGSWNVTAASGNVTIRVPANAAFDLDAQSASGRIDSEHPVTLVGSVSRRELHGRVRGGGPRIALSTASGAIRIR